MFDLVLHGATTQEESTIRRTRHGRANDNSAALSSQPLVLRFNQQWAQYQRSELTAGAGKNGTIVEFETLQEPSPLAYIFFPIDAVPTWQETDSGAVQGTDDMVLDTQTPPGVNLAAPTRPEIQSSLHALYKEQCDQARQHETMRPQATAIALTLVGAVVSLATASGGALAFMRGSGTLPNLSPVFFALYSLLGFFVIGIGRHGRRLRLKHYERNRFHTERARTYRKRIEELFPGCNFADGLREDAKSAHKRRWEKEIGASLTGVIDEHLYILWLDLFQFLIGVGCFMVLVPLVVALVLSSRSADPGPQVPAPKSLSSEFSQPGNNDEMPRSSQAGFLAPQSLPQMSKTIALTSSRKYATNCSKGLSEPIAHLRLEWSYNVY